MTDLRERVPGHSLIDELIRQWELGNISVDDQTNAVIAEDAHGWYRGVLGERRVAEILDELEECVVLHSVPVGSGTTDIDHVVVSQAGVFTINSKYSPGRDVWFAGRGMFVGGFKQAYILNSLREAGRAADALSKATGMTVPVTGVIVFIEPGKLTQKATPGGDDGDPEIKVVRDVRLLSALRGSPIFSPEQAGRILDAAVRPETWHRSPVESTTGASIAREFLALEEALGPRLAQEYAAPVAATRSRGSAAQSAKYAAARASKARVKKQAKREKMLVELLGAITLIVGALIGLALFAGR